MHNKKEESISMVYPFVSTPRNTDRQHRAFSRTHLVRQLPNGRLIHLWDFFHGFFSLLGLICKATGQFLFFSLQVTLHP